MRNKTKDNYRKRKLLRRRTVEKENYIKKTKEK